MVPNITFRKIINRRSKSQLHTAPPCPNMAHRLPSAQHSATNPPPVTGTRIFAGSCGKIRRFTEITIRSWVCGNREIWRFLAKVGTVNPVYGVLPPSHQFFLNNHLGIILQYEEGQNFATGSETSCWVIASRSIEIECCK